MSLTNSPFGRFNATVSQPLYCSCTPDPLGAYSGRPLCGDRMNIRSAHDRVYFGPELYDGYYGQAFKLRFPDYNGPTYQATIPTFGSSSMLAASGPHMVVGDSHGPYFRVYNIKNAPPQQVRK